MPLTEEQKREMEHYYAMEHHGFHDNTLANKYLSSMTPAEYEDLWQMTFGDFLKTTGIPSIEQAKKEYGTNSRLEEIFGRLDFKDGSGRLFDYVVDDVYDRTFSDILTHKSIILNHLKQEKQEITSDFNETDKRSQFLTATGYNASSDGDEMGYFFRFWRYPVSKTFNYRGIDVSTPAGSESAEQILTALFGPNAKNYMPQDLMNDTPEHLVEQREEIEQRQREAQRAKTEEKQRLTDQPFYETLIFSGLSFADTSDLNTVAAQAAQQRVAHSALAEYIRTDETFDEDIFKTVIGMTPNQIKAQSDTLKADLTLRADNRFLSDNPDATLDNFLSARRGKASPSGATEDREKARQTLQQILNTSYPVDDRAVQDCLNIKCTDLMANSATVIKNIKKRKHRRALVLTSLITTFSALALWGSWKAFKAASNGIDSLAEKTTAVTSEYAKKISSYTPSFGSSDHTQPATASVQNMTLKGNRPVLGFYWKGWVDSSYKTEEPLAFQQAITGEFNHTLDKIKRSALTFDSVFNPDYITKRVINSGSEWQPEVIQGQEPVRFYIGGEGKHADAQQDKLNKENMAKDLLNYYYNMQDVLNSLPVSAANLSANQALAMEAIGPTIGWSIHQQLSWAQKNADQNKAASAAIIKGAQGILKAQKSDASDVEAVFKATCLSVKNYRETHPDIQSYLLLTDNAIRQITGTELQDLNQFAHFKPADMKQATAHVEKAEKELYASAAKTTPKGKPQKPVDKGYPWGWIIGTAAATLYLFSAIIMENRRIIR